MDIFLPKSGSKSVLVQSSHVVICTLVLVVKCNDCLVHMRQMFIECKKLAFLS